MKPIHWEPTSFELVVQPGGLHGSLDRRRAGAGHVLRLADRYRLYYWGSGDQGHVILMAEAPLDQPNAWEPVGQVLLGKQSHRQHNADGPSFPFVIPGRDERWLMMLGHWGQARDDGKLPNSTGLAVSDDAGATWRYHDQNPILPLDREYDQSGTGSVCVVSLQGEYRMYYTAIGAYFSRPEGVQTGHGDRIPRIGIGFATSRDGMAWQKPRESLMVEPRGFAADPYEYINSKPFVLPEATGYRMWISTFGTAYRIRSLWSADGLCWHRFPSGPEGDSGIGPPGSFDDQQRCYACVAREGDEYRCWYTGNGFGATGMGYVVGYEA